MPQSIAITTPQNVVIEYPLANLGDRILAFIIDTLIKGAYLLILLFLVVPIANGDLISFASALLFILALPVILYSLLFEVFTNGQTPGKKAMDIKVIDLNGDEVRFSSYFLRWLFRIVDILMMTGIIGTLVIALSEKGQRIGDIVANTSVISLKRKATVEESAYDQVSETHQPKYPGAADLQASDIVTIKEVLSMKGDDAYKMKKLLSEKIEEVLQVSKDGSSSDFLKQVVKDFNFYQQDVY